MKNKINTLNVQTVGETKTEKYLTPTTENKTTTNAWASEIEIDNTIKTDDVNAVNLCLRSDYTLEI